MAVPSSGALDFTDLQDEFGGSNPISISEYYRDGGLVPSNNTNVPTSGAVALSDFYGAVNEIGVTASAASSANLKTLFDNASAGSWASAVPKKYTINSGTTMGILTAPASMGGTLIINNSGNIQGTGGAAGTGGVGGAAGTAMTVQSTGITINMLSGSTLSGGGGGGGKGGTGGNGQYYVCYSGCGGGGCSVVGGCEGDNSDYCSCSSGGGAGGAGGRGAGYGQALANGSGGAGGGTNAGSGGTGGNGASFGAAGSTGNSGAGGNAGGGSGGSSGGAAGRAVTFSGVSAYTIIGTNSGTIHGAYT